jgi:integrase
MGEQLMKRKLSDAMVAGLRPGVVYDSQVPGLAVRTMPSGAKSFVLVARFPGSPNPTRRSLGKVGTLNVAAARERARAWHEQIRQGRDPSTVEADARAAVVKQAENTFAAAFEAWCEDKLASERRGQEVARDVRKYFAESWKLRPIADITENDVLAIIIRKKRTAPTMARSLLISIKRFFRWAVAQKCYGLTKSPIDDLRALEVVGDKAFNEGDRTLSDVELRALWHAAGRLGGPQGAVYKVLALTGLRLNEVADAAWSEFDIPNRLWTIPSSRMKGKNFGRGRARAHEVPLTDAMLDAINALPRFKGAKYVFSATGGTSPVWISSDIKHKLDGLMLDELQKDNPDAVLPPWKNHDIRRTARSCWSRYRLGAEEEREATLAHRPPGIKKIYNTHDYRDEKRALLEAWAATLRGIVGPRPVGNVVQLHGVA